MQLEALIENIDSTCNIMQEQAINSVSSSLTLRNWIIGYYIVEYEQMGQDRAKYGDKLIISIAKKLSHIRGLSTTNLKLFKMFYRAYPQISQAVTGQFKLEFLKSQSLTDQFSLTPTEKLLSSCTFTHFVEFVKINDALKRVFYEVETIKGNWSVRELKRQINSQAYERIGLSKDKKEMISSITQQ